MNDFWKMKESVLALLCIWNYVLAVLFWMNNTPWLEGIIKEKSYWEGDRNQSQQNTVCLKLLSQCETRFAPALASFETIPSRLYVLLCSKLRSHLLLLKQSNYCNCKIWLVLFFTLKRTMVLLFICFLENVMFYV